MVAKATKVAAKLRIVAKAKNGLRRNKRETNFVSEANQFREAINVKRKRNQQRVVKRNKKSYEKRI